MLVARVIMRHQLFPAHRVLREAACRQYDTFRCLHLNWTSGRVDDCSNRPTIVVSQQGANRGAGPDWHALVETGFRQPRDQRVAVHQPHGAAMEQLVPAKLQQQFRHEPHGHWGSGDVEEMQQFFASADHHAEERDLCQRWAQAADFITEFSPIKRPRDDGASAIHPTGRLWVIVSEGRAKVELQGGFFFVERHRLWSCLQKRIDAGAIKMRARFMRQVGAGRLDAVFHACALGGGVVRDPHPAA